MFSQSDLIEPCNFSAAISATHPRVGDKVLAGADSATKIVKLDMVVSLVVGGCVCYLTSVRYKELSTKNTKDTKNRSDYADFISFHFTNNAKVQLLFRAFRAFRGQELLMSNSGYLEFQVMPWTPNYRQWNLTVGKTQV
jgi:hypothetical protein